jgi:hypothetical protein
MGQSKLLLKGSGMRLVNRKENAARLSGGEGCGHIRGRQHKSEWHQTDTGCVITSNLAIWRGIASFSITIACMRCIDRRHYRLIGLNHGATNKVSVW